MQYTKLENSLKRDSVSAGSEAESNALAGDVFELDTLELTRRGRREQARYMAELAAAGVRGAVELGRRVLRAIESCVSTRERHSLKGN